MLIEFTVGNFRSFRDKVTLSMVATKLKSMPEYEDVDVNNVIMTSGQPNLLTSAAIYGANASGKSNVIAALTTMQRMVITSAIGIAPTTALPVEPFRLNLRTIEEPSHFEIVMVVGGQRYRYGFEATRIRVIREWLFTVPKRTEVRLFERELDTITVSSAFREGKGLEERTRANALFLSVAAQFNSQIADQLVSWFWRITTGSSLSSRAMRCITDKDMVKGKNSAEIKSLVTKLDLGILDVRPETRADEDPAVPSELPEEMRGALQTLMRFSKGNNSNVEIKTLHKVFDDTGAEVDTTEFDLDKNESAGTQRLFALAGPLLNTLRNGNVAVIDELDASLHPTMLEDIVSLFNNRQTNPNNAQLIFATHNTNLLSYKFFRRDQIWFVEKESTGASRLYSLAEFKGVRNDRALESSYLLGRFGAVPYVEDLQEIIRESVARYGAQEK